MTEQLPDWLAVPLIAILGVVALYRCYILPNYEKDQNEDRIPRPRLDVFHSVPALPREVVCLL